MPRERRRRKLPSMRVLVVTLPLAGHLLPMRPLARALQRRGHAVCWASSDAARTWLTSEDAPLDDMGLPQGRWARDRLLQRWPELQRLAPRERAARLGPRLFGDVYAHGMLPGVRDVVARWRPDLVLHGLLAQAAPLAANEADVPHVSHGFGLPLPAPTERDLLAFLEPAWRAVLGVPPAALHSPHGHVDLCPPSLRPQPAAPETGPGAPLWAQSPAGTRPRGTGAPVGTPRVVASFGTVQNEGPDFSAVLEALADGPWPARVAAGHGHPAARRPWPAHLVVSEWMDLDEAWADASAMVCHGGAGTLLGALAHGVPLLVLPQAADNFRNGAALAASGAGLVWDGRGDAAHWVRHGLHRLHAEPHFAVAARTVAREIAAMPRPEHTARAIEQRFERR